MWVSHRVIFPRFLFVERLGSRISKEQQWFIAVFFLAFISESLIVPPTDEQSSTRRPLYDWVVLLGGTNDLGWGKPVFDIHDALTSVSDIALENGAKVLLCTVPECGVKRESLDRKRDGLNTFIKSDIRDDV